VVPSRHPVKVTFLSFVGTRSEKRNVSTFTSAPPPATVLPGLRRLRRSVIAKKHAYVPHSVLGRAEDVNAWLCEQRHCPVPSSDK
jgi:hypothetical protein